MRVLIDGDTGAEALGVTLLLVVLGVLTFCQTFVYYDLETLYADTIAKNPTSWTAYANLSMHYITVGRKTEAYGLAERAVELAPQDSLTNGNLAALLLADAISEDAASGKLAQAVAYFQKSVALDAANLPAHKGLGYALMKSGRFTEAEQQLLPVCRQRRRTPMRYTHSGWCGPGKNVGTSRAAYLQCSLRAEPADIDTHRALADVLEKLGRADEAHAQRDAATHLATARPRC